MTNDRSEPLTEAQLSGFRHWGRTDRDWTTRTQENYSRRVRATDRWMISKGHGDLDHATVQDLQAWYQDQSAHPGTRNNYRSALVGYFAWLVATGRRRENPAAQLPTHRKRRTVPKALTVVQTRNVLHEAEDEGPDWHACVALMLYAGLRISEARMLAWADLEGDYVRVVGKGNHERIVPLAPRAQEIVEAWRPRCPSPAWIFPSVQDAYRPRCYTAIYDRLRAIGERAGLVGLHPHRLRHTFATELVARGADIRSVQELLGHASVHTTTVYLRVRPAQLTDAVAKLGDLAA